MGGSGSTPGASVGPFAPRQPEAQSTSLSKEGFFLISPELRAAGDTSLEGQGTWSVPQVGDGRRFPREPEGGGVSEPPAAGIHRDMLCG